MNDPRTALLFSAVALCAGVWASLVGFEFFGKPAGADLSPQYGQRRRLYRLGGPIVIVLAVLSAVLTLTSGSQGVKWQKYEPADAHFSIDVPAPPVESVVEETGEYGPAFNYVAKVRIRRSGVTCFVRHTRLPRGFPDRTADQTRDLLKKLVANVLKMSNGKLLEERALSHPAGEGREFRIELERGYVYKGQILFLGGTHFQLDLIAPGNLIDTGLASRFFGSFEYDGVAPKLTADKEPE